MAMTSTVTTLSGEVGESIPPDTAHVTINFPSIGKSNADAVQAVSVSLPTWKANVGYEEGEDWVLGKMKTGYPRFAHSYNTPIAPY